MLCQWEITALRSIRYRTLALCHSIFWSLAWKKAVMKSAGDIKMGRAVNSKGARSLGLLSKVNAIKHCFGRGKLEEARKQIQRKEQMASERHDEIQWLKLKAGQAQPDVRHPQFYTGTPRQSPAHDQHKAFPGRGPWLWHFGKHRLTTNIPSVLCPYLHS